VGETGNGDNPGHNGSSATATAAAADEDTVILQPQEEQQQPEEAAAAAAAADEKDWSSVDPAAVEALRKLVAALCDARSLGPVRLQPRGLVNTGNSCFMNCTLQVGKEHRNIRALCVDVCVVVGIGPDGWAQFISAVSPTSFFTVTGHLPASVAGPGAAAAERAGQHWQQLLHELHAAGGVNC
jgi:hypothetical protein